MTRACQPESIGGATYPPLSQPDRAAQISTPLRDRRWPGRKAGDQSEGGQGQRVKHRGHDLGRHCCPTRRRRVAKPASDRDKPRTKALYI